MTITSSIQSSFCFVLSTSVLVPKEINSRLGGVGKLLVALQGQAQASTEREVFFLLSVLFALGWVFRNVSPFSEPAVPLKRNDTCNGGDDYNVAFTYRRGYNFVFVRVPANVAHTTCVLLHFPLDFPR